MITLLNIVNIDKKRIIEYIYINGQEHRVGA